MTRYLFARLLAHAGAALPLIWLFFAIPAGALGADPVKELIHFLGLGAIRLCLLTLFISPLAKLLKLPRLNSLRRPLGLWCFTWASLHILAWIVFDLAFDWLLLLEEICKRAYIWLGLLAWLIFVALAITSLPKCVRAMGPRWKKLHGFLYLAVLMACIHYWWALKSGWIEPAVYLAVSLMLLSIRMKKLKRWISTLAS